MYGENYAKLEVDRIMASMDRDGSGKIEFSEYIQASVDKAHLLQEDNIWNAFT